MRNMFKKVICGVLVAIMMITSTAPAFAVDRLDSSNTETSTSADIQYLTEAVCLATQVEGTVLSGYDIEQLRFGNTLETYMIVEGVLATTDSEYVPLFWGNQLVAMANIIKSDNEIIGVELSAELVEELSYYVNSEIGIVFSDSAAYVYDGSKTTMVKTYQYNLTVQTSTTQFNSMDEQALNTQVDSCTISNLEIATNTITGQYSFDSILTTTEATNANVSLASGSSTPVRLYAEVIPQNGLPICWAAAVASVGLEITGIRKTAETVSMTMLGKYAAAPLPIALQSLQTIYGLDGLDCGYAPTFAQIRDIVGTHHQPIYVTAATSMNRHAFFVDGYIDYTAGSGSSYDGMLYVGDPNYPSTYKSLFFVTDGTYPYTISGATGYIDQFILLY